MGRPRFIAERTQKLEVPAADESTLDEINAHVALLNDPDTPHRLAIVWQAGSYAVGLVAVALFVSNCDRRPGCWRQAELKELIILQPSPDAGSLDIVLNGALSGLLTLAEGSKNAKGLTGVGQAFDRIGVLFLVAGVRNQRYLRLLEGQVPRAAA